jgi:hypothetical protein
MQKLALTLLTRGGRSVGIVRLRTKATDFFNPQKASTKIAGILAKIQIEHLPNISLKWYDYTSLFSIFMN